jgi:hypothetical protein
MELHVMAQRLHANKRAAAERGELRTPLPVGYVHDEAGDIVIDPDAAVQAAIADVFAAFTARGSAYGVVAAFAGRRFPLRAYGGAWASPPTTKSAPSPQPGPQRRPNPENLRKSRCLAAASTLRRAPAMPPCAR